MILPCFKKCRAAAIDLDGTLLNSKSQLSPRSCVVLDACIKNKLPVIIATSRAERSVRQLLGNELADRLSLVMENGGMIKGAPPLSGSRKEIIPQEIVEQVISRVLSLEPSVRMGIEIDGFDFGCNLPLDRETLWRLNRATPEMLFSLEEASRREATKLWINGLGKNLSSLTKVLYQEFGDSISIFPNANFNFLDMPSNRTSKAIGVQYLLSSQRISLTDVVAIGDDNPDLPLLEVCGIPIAMANASPEILACTLFRTASNDEDGVAIVLEQVLTNYANC